VKLLTRFFRRWMARNFHAVRLSLSGKPPALSGQALMVVLNHPSWWDPLFGMILADLFASYRHFVPIDSIALKQYRFFEPLGFFGVDSQTPTGALHFLGTGARILSQPGNALWITAQGRFVDPRERPVQLRQGVGHLLRRVENVVVLPLAIEYPFWQERFPEALAHFGEPLFVDRGRDFTVDEWMEKLHTRLTKAQDDLAEIARLQDSANFATLVDGNVGVGGVYDLWRLVKALVVGKSFHAGHGKEPAAPSVGGRS
jgi:1-acyl-sn-glycerol-3-phosphate acyltransferase